MLFNVCAFGNGSLLSLIILHFRLILSTKHVLSAKVIIQNITEISLFIHEFKNGDNIFLYVFFFLLWAHIVLL